MCAAVPGPDQLLSIFIWFVVAGALVAVGFLAALAVRRWMQREEPVQTFTFQDLRDMRARGEISESEFAAMRAVLLAQAAAPDDAGAEPRGPTKPDNPPADDA
jgi:hypothetical protein